MYHGMKSLETNFQLYRPINKITLSIFLFNINFNFGAFLQNYCRVPFSKTNYNLNVKFHFLNLQ